MAAGISPDGTKPAPAVDTRFMPQFVTLLQDGYDLQRLRIDLLAGLTVAIVALPLSMALAIASGLSPDRGLASAIVAGFLISLLSGSRFQIGGPAGAFIVLVSATLARHGIDGLMLATLLAGVIMVAFGVARLGTFIRFIPYSVTVGFTAGIGLLIATSQIRDALGLAMPNGQPSDFIEKVGAYGTALSTINPSAGVITVASLVLMVAIRRFRPAWPHLLIAIVVISIAVIALQVPVETIGTRFGAVATNLSVPALPTFTWDRILNVLPDAIAFALLGSIESLLSAVVADRLTGQSHRSNIELVAQGVANIAAACFGAMIATGTIARTATNIRAGSTGPVSGLAHAVILFAALALAGPLMSAIPLAALAALLLLIAWNMIDRTAIKAMAHTSWRDFAVMSLTLGTTVLRDLMTGIVAGVALHVVLTIWQRRGEMPRA